MATPPLFVNRINVACAQDTALIIIGAPAGPIQDGQITSVEVARLVMSHQTFKEVAELFAAKVRENEAMAKAAAKLRQAQPEQRTFEADEDGVEAAVLRLN
jgi:hypothetical protein